MKKKKILFHSNHSRAFTGFGKNCKNALLHLHNTGKYEIVEFCNGISWSAPHLKNLPWKTYGSLPDDQRLLQQLNKDPQLGRAAGYGANMIDQVIKQEKPDVYVGAEDIWAFGGYTEKPWWNKTNCMIWTTLDSLPLLPDSVKWAPKIKNYYVWASFAEKAMKQLGHGHVKTLHGSVDCNTFYRLKDEDRLQLRQRHGIDKDSFIIGFVFRNQLRKSVPNLLKGFKAFLKKNPNSKAKLLLHTHWGEGWDIPRLLEELSIDPSLVLTTYFCSTCGNYSVQPFTGQEQQCRACGAKTLNTTNTQKGVNEKQLNEVYNLMDVYCHPFTSGGQELPIQEAKLTELITLVTNYSCGEDSCCPESGGIPLEWSEYREPGTQFIKASTLPSSISNSLERVYKMPPERRAKQGKKSRQYILDHYDSKVIGKKLESIFDKMPSIDWDFDFSFKVRDPNYNPPNIESDSEWIIDLYKNILSTEVDDKDSGHEHWMKRLKTDMNRAQVLEYFKNVALKENSENQKIGLESFFDKSSKKKALMVCNGDFNMVFAATSLFESFAESYKDTELYFSCNPNFFPVLDGNPFITGIIPYNEKMEDELLMTGRGNNKGYVDYYINLTRSNLKNLTSINTYAEQ